MCQPPKVQIQRRVDYDIQGAQLKSLKMTIAKNITIDLLYPIN
jgi:hypothetical protein